MADAGKKVVLFGRHQQRASGELKARQRRFRQARAKWLATGRCDHPEEFESDSTQLAGDRGSRRCTVCDTVLDPAYR